MKVARPTTCAHHAEFKIKPQVKLVDKDEQKSKDYQSTGADRLWPAKTTE